MIDRQEQLERLRSLTWDEIAEDPAWEREMRGLFYFFNTVMMSSVNLGVHFRGCSFAWKGLHCRLCVRVTIDDIPQVAFVSERNPTHCVVVFCSMWLEERVKWYPDKFA